MYVDNSILVTGYLYVNYHQTHSITSNNYVTISPKHYRNPVLRYNFLTFYSLNSTFEFKTCIVLGGLIINKILLNENLILEVIYNITFIINCGVCKFHVRFICLKLSR